jgi:tetratricopeptide (TPR) repeat protein
MNSNEENNIQERIDLYLNDTMAASERLLFEKELKENPSLREEVLLQKSISEVIFDNDFSHIEDSSKAEELAEIKKTLQREDYKEYTSNIENASRTYMKRKQNKRLLYFSSIAAAILISVSVLLFPKEQSFDELYAEYADWDQLTSYVEQSNLQNEFAKGEILYTSKKYTEAIQFFETYRKNKNNNLYAPSLMYLGASYFGNDNDTKALEIYDILIDSDSYDSSKGYWYKLLIYLKQKDTEQIKKTLETILSHPNYYKHQLAVEIDKAL